MRSLFASSITLRSRFVRPRFWIDGLERRLASLLLFRCIDIFFGPNGLVYLGFGSCIVRAFNPDGFIQVDINQRELQYSDAWIITKINIIKCKRRCVARGIREMVKTKRINQKLAKR